MSASLAPFSFASPSCNLHYSLPLRETTSTTITTIRALELLPNEIFGYIFDYLQVSEVALCAAVCQRWRNNWAWKSRLSLAPASSKVTDAIIHSIFARCKQLQYLDLGRCYSVTSRALDFAAAMPTLMSLNIDYCHRLEDEGFISLSSATQLRSLSIAFNCKLTIAGLDHLVRLPLPLTSLSLRGCKSLDSEALGLIARLSTLEALDLSESSAALTKKGFQAFAVLTRLRELKLFRCFLNDALLPFLTNLVNLVHLELGENAGISAVGTEFVSGLTSLKFLSLRQSSKLSDGALLHLALLTNLETLDLSRCSTIQDSGTIFLRRLKKLKTLDLTGCHIGDESLQGFSCYETLETLSLWQCPISDTGAKHLLWLQTLTSLDLTNCSNITNTGLEYIGKITRLTSLKLRGLLHISDSGIKKILPLKELKVLSVSWCSSITDQAIPTLAKFPSLTSLDLSSCRRLTIDSLQLIEKYYAGLPALNVAFCWTIPIRRILSDKRKKLGLETQI